MNTLVKTDQHLSCWRFTVDWEPCACYIYLEVVRQAAFLRQGFSGLSRRACWNKSRFSHFSFLAAELTWFCLCSWPSITPFPLLSPFTSGHRNVSTFSNPKLCTHSFQDRACKHPFCHLGIFFMLQYEPMLLNVLLMDAITNKCFSEVILLVSPIMNFWCHYWSLSSRGSIGWCRIHARG